MLSRFLGNRSDMTRDDPFTHLQREIGRVVEDTVRGMPALRAGLGLGFAPSLDLRETPQGLELTAELPGLREEDIELSLEGDMLVLAGEKREERTATEGGMHLQERSFGRFQRSLRLPFAPEQGSVSAQFDMGVLHVSLPRPAQAAPRDTRIPIRGTAQGQSQGEHQGSGRGQGQPQGSAQPRPAGQPHTEGQGGPSEGGVGPSAAQSGNGPAEEAPAGDAGTGMAAGHATAPGGGAATGGPAGGGVGPSAAQSGSGAPGG